MAGHSKWANIKHRKAVVDARRGKLFTRASKEIIVAARLGGGDPDHNPRLRMAVQNARAVSMPVDNIKRAIQRGTGEIEGANYEDMTFEGYGPGGVAVIVECTSENRNRTVQEVRATFSKYGGNLGETNSVNWNFSRKGEVKVNTTLTEDELFEIAVDVGADDVMMVDDGAVINCAVDVFGTVAHDLAQRGLDVADKRQVNEPNNMVEITTKEQAKLMMKLLDAFDDNDDVQNVFNNAEIDDAIVEALA
ncbi:MAG: YebC/PmpR family DNA-binding transcriptional regulator [Ignavibacteriae bacterium]|nr:MAG: YebC/PmpR family DNA-binding transcriptional regulator [Ignavibacteriota bacterium]